LRPRTDKIVAPERQVELLDLIGTTIGGKYKLERLLGAGGMGGVYAASPAGGGAQVAVKVLSVADPASRERIAGRFAREARAVTALNCPHIVSVLDAGSEAARPYLVMELLEGEDLGQRLQRDARLPVADALHVVAQVLVALGSAHEAGVVHRDLKPDNIFLTTRGSDRSFCKLLDFGMSKLTPRENQTLALALTKKGMAVGTPFYMAPEQARALDDVDGRADLWALGAILFECLAGRPPFVGSSQQQVLIAICTTDAPDVRALRPDVPSKVAKLVARALARDRSQRFVSAWQMLAAVVEVAPAEAALLPASAATAIDVRAPVPAAIFAAPRVAAPRAASSPDASSGPFPAQPAQRLDRVVTAPPIVELPPAPRSADRSGSNPSLRLSRPTPRAPAPARGSRALLVMLAVGALLLGVGVAVYVLALTHPR
jgi:serine/threonine protein kinase